MSNPNWLRQFGFTFALLIEVPGCTHHTDLRGRSTEAQAWAAAQAHADAERAKRFDEQQRNSPIAKPEPREARSGDAWPALRPHTGTRARPVEAQRASSPDVEQTAPAHTDSDGAGSIGVGTCFAIDGSGTLVTAHHVISGSQRVAVKFANEALITATVVRSSEAMDLAVLHVERKTREFLPLAPLHAARLGLPVFTIGFPVPDYLGWEPKFTNGAISALSGSHDEAAQMQITVAVQPGNSGGPLVNVQGEVVGVIIARANDLNFMREKGMLPQNINFATKADNLNALLQAAPATRSPALSRQAAIDRVTQAVCLIVVQK